MAYQNWIPASAAEFNAKLESIASRAQDWAELQDESQWIGTEPMRSLMDLFIKAFVYSVQVEFGHKDAMPDSYSAAMANWS